jgi:hypothetical protein
LTTRAKNRQVSKEKESGKKGSLVKKRSTLSPRTRISIVRARKEAKRATKPSALATDANNDIIPSEEVMRESLVRCDTCKTDFASRKDFETHTLRDHSDIPAKRAK